MKKIVLTLIAILLMLPACAPREPQQKPNNRPKDYMQEDNLENKELETDKSAIFQVGDVRNIKITTNVADVKAGAGNSFSTIRKMKQNDTLDVLGQIGNWYVVKLDNNQVGSVDSKDATPIVKKGTSKEDQAQQQLTGPKGIDPGNQENVPDDRENNQQPQATDYKDQNAPQDTTTKLGSKEQQMLDLVNNERSKNGLSPLKADYELARVAATKSQDMVDNNYFSHNSPTYGSPFDMMKSFGIKYLTAGENLAGNSNVDRAHTSLMNSSGHRKNILSPNFTHIGIGIRPSDRYGYVFTQMFIGK